MSVSPPWSPSGGWLNIGIQMGLSQWMQKLAQIADVTSKSTAEVYTNVTEFAVRTNNPSLRQAAIELDAAGEYFAASMSAFMGGVTERETQVMTTLFEKFWTTVRQLHTSRQQLADMQSMHQTVVQMTNIVRKGR